jgi:ABC-type amino acid transport substrate-binding protein
MNGKNITTLVLSIVFSVTLSIVAVFFMKTNDSSDSSSVKMYRSVIESGEIRAAYYVGAPYFIKDPNTNEITGIFAEVVEKAASKLDLKVKWVEEVGFGDMVTGLESGRYDIVGSGIWINAARGKGADFSIPLLYDVVGVYVREDDTRFDNNIELINSEDIRISAIDGEMAAVIANTDFPKAELVSLPQLADFSQMILNVVNNKADVTFLGLAAANNYLKNNPGTITNIAKEAPIRVFPTAIMIKRGEYEFKRMLDLALMEMINNGEVEKIIKAYEELPYSHYRAAYPYRGE